MNYANENHGQYLICGKGTDFRQGVAGEKQALVSPALGHSPVKHILGHLWKPLLLYCAVVVVGFDRIGLEGHLTSLTDVASQWGLLEW